ncbi:MAG TPA: RNA polymerase subunit sigma, partial [Dyella sp.]
MDVAVDEDATLMLAYAQGDVAAFEALYARHRGMLYRFLLRAAHDRHVADELFQ